MKFVHPRRGGGKVLNTISYGEALTRGPTPYLFIIHFGIKDTPFVFMLLKNGTPVTYYFVTLHNL